jgi:YHS domain-containing protein
LTAAAAFGATFAGIPAFAEERPSGTQQVMGSANAKRGDQVACAVDGMKMPLAVDTPSAEYHGTVYYFCDESEKETFLKDPERYSTH